MQANFNTFTSYLQYNKIRTFFMLLPNKSTPNSKKGGPKESANKSFGYFDQNSSSGSKKTLKLKNQNAVSQLNFTQNKQSQFKQQLGKHPLKAKNMNVLGQSANFKENITSQTSAEFEKKPSANQYFSYENYSFRKLSSQHRKPALELLTQSFIQEQPLAKAYYKQFPQQKVDSYQFWEEYWDMFMDDVIQTGISLAVVDVDKNEELIGVYTFKNFNYFPPNPLHDEKYLKGFTIISAEVVLQEELIQKSPPEVQDILLNSPMIAEAWAAAVKDEHTGKKLYSMMTALAEKVLRDAGFEYALVFASNFVSSKVLKKLQFTKLSETDCEQFELMGNKPFAYIQEMHKNPSLWFKSFR